MRIPIFVFDCIIPDKYRLYEKVGAVILMYKPRPPDSCLCKNIAAAEAFMHKIFSENSLAPVSAIDSEIGTKTKHIRCQFFISLKNLAQPIAGAPQKPVKYAVTSNIC